MRIQILIASLVLTVAIGTVPASGQQDNSGADVLNTPTGLRCSALSEVEEAERAGVVYYVAGYDAGERAAMTIATVGESNEEAGETGAGTMDRAPTSVANAMPPLSTEAVLAACASSPDSRIVDVVVAHGGATSQGMSGAGQ